MKDPILILGAGGHAKVIIDIISITNEYQIEAIIGQESEEKESFYGYPVYKGDQYLEEFRERGIKKVAIGVGGYRDNNKRIHLFHQLQDMDFDIINIIHPSTIISKTTQMGLGIVIYPGVVINTDVHLGDNIIIASNSVIDHEAQIMNHVLISTGVNVGAGSIISEGALLAVGSSIIPRVKIGKNVLVAAGAVVVNDIPDGSKIFGIPAKIKNVYN